MARLVFPCAIKRNTSISLAGEAARRLADAVAPPHQCFGRCQGRHRPALTEGADRRRPLQAGSVSVPKSMACPPEQDLNASGFVGRIEFTPHRQGLTQRREGVGCPPFPDQYGALCRQRHRTEPVRPQRCRDRAESVR